MAPHQERRRTERRRAPSTAVDVTRLEHENLCGQIDEVIRSLHRIEGQLHSQEDRIAVLERDIGALVRTATRSA